MPFWPFTCEIDTAAVGLTFYSAFASSFFPLPSFAAALLGSLGPGDDSKGYGGAAFE